MAPLITAFVLLLAFTGATSAVNRRLSRGQPKAPHDRSSLWLGLAHTASLLAGVLFPWLGIGGINVGPALGWVGVGLLVAGFALQLAAMLTLQGLYSLSLQARSEQRVVTRGPYRWIRHPGYLAQMVFWLGFALASRNAVVLGVVVLSDLGVYLHRIRVEERLLLDTLGDAYRSYAARTRRLLPGIW